MNILIFCVMSIFLYAGPETDLLSEINNARAENGAPALAMNFEAARLARYRAEEMVALDFFGHGSRLYGEPCEMLIRFGVPFTSAGVNIAKGQPTAEEVVRAWLASPAHAENLLNENFTSAGVGIALDEGIYCWTLFLISET